MADVQLHKKGDSTELWFPKTKGSIVSLEGYSKATSVSPISGSDDLNTALGKLEYNIDAKLISVYKIKPSQPADFIGDSGSLMPENIGNVYNITGSFTTNSNFVDWDGTGKKIPANSNIVIVDTGSGIKFDVLGMPMDAYKGSTQSANGSAGLVRQPLIADRTSFLCGNGNWEDIEDIAATFNTSHNGLVPKPTSAQASGNYYLKASGGWAEVQGGGGSGEVDNGTKGYFAYYPSTGAKVSGLDAIQYDSTNSCLKLNATLLPYSGNNYGSIGSGSTRFGDVYTQDLYVDSVNVAGYLTIYTGANYSSLTEKVRITQDGKVGIGKTTPSVALEVSGGIVGDEVTAVGSSSSDKRFKDNIKPFNALDIVNKLNPVSFTWNNTAKAINKVYQDGVNYGLIAQECDGVIDNLVFDLPMEGGYKGVRYEKLIPILLQAIKEQQKEIDELKKLVK